MVSTAADTHGRRTVVEYVASRRRLYPVGRLDVDTTGLILLTNDGALADRLTHPRYGVQKVYRASVRPADISDGRGQPPARRGDAGRRPHQPGAGGRCWAPGSWRSRSPRDASARCGACARPSGYKVSSLERVRFGPLTLGGLPEGESRALTAAEVAELYASRGLG